MKHLLCCCASLMSICASLAQSELKYYDYNWSPCPANQARFLSEITKTDSGYYHRDYFIHEKSLQMAGLYMDGQGKIRHGHFYYFHSNKNIESFGRYHEGKKQGLWLSYHANGMMHDSTFYENGEPVGISMSWWPDGAIMDSTHYNPDGTAVHVSWFENGLPSSAGRYVMQKIRTGTWQFFHMNGKLAARKTYVNGKQTETQLFDENGNMMATDIDQDRDPEFPGGAQGWAKYLRKRVYFPDGFQITNADEAVVVVSFAVDADGKIGDAYVSTPFYPQFDRIALKAIQESPNWKPAIRDNRRIKTWYRQAITFAQPE